MFVEVNEPENPVIKIPTVKWKEGGLLLLVGGKDLLAGPPRENVDN